MELKRVDQLTIANFRRYPVWTYVPETRTRDETWMKPVRKIPVDDLDGKIVGSQVRLSCGRQVWAMIGNVDVRDANANEHLIGLSVRIGRTWFHLARYHDIDYENRSPSALAKTLSLPVSQVFPITYDLRPFARGDERALQGEFLRVPKNGCPKQH